MRLAKRTMYRYLLLLIVGSGILPEAFSQENSPYSRYGLGDISPNQNILSRGMGGIAAGISDLQSINFVNPASYSNIPKTIFDMGAEADTRTLKSINPTAKFTSTNLVVSYMQLAFPIRMKKANKKQIFLASTFGLRPVSKINYRILKNSRISGIDSLETVYEGSGGLTQAYTGAALRIKNFSIGANFGYMFGNKDYNTRLSFINDTINYYKSNSASETNFGGLFLNLGVQYQIRLKNEAMFRIGAYGNLKQNMKATQRTVRETEVFDVTGNAFRVDSVFETNTKGTITYPSSFGVGATYQTEHWLFGADFESTSWQNYRFFGQPDLLKNNWKMRVGTEFFPAKMNTPIKKYFSFVRYRMGFFYGPDYININNNLPEYGFTFGAGFPLKLRRNFYETQSSMLNTAIEIGSRGNKSNNLRENIFRVSVGVSLSDIWFRRAKYD